MMLSVSFAQVGCWATIFFSISKPASASCESRSKTEWIVSITSFEEATTGESFSRSVMRA